MVIVNPTTPIGERDIKPTPTGRIVVDFLNWKFPAYVETGLNLVDATECARGHIQALEKGRSGERYILGGENLTLKQILDRLAAITGLPSPTVNAYIFALAAGVVDEMVTGRILGREPRATIDAVRMGRKMMFVSSAKAEREVGLADGSSRRGVAAVGRVVQGERVCLAVCGKIRMTQQDRRGRLSPHRSDARRSTGSTFRGWSGRRWLELP